MDIQERILQLKAKKDRDGFLSGNDALEAIRIFNLKNATEEKGWTDEWLLQLTNFQLGRPVKSGYGFQVVAGEPIEMVRHARSSANDIVLDRVAQRRAKTAARVRSLRQATKCPLATENTGT